MLYIDGKEYTMTEQEVSVYTKRHTWVKNPQHIKYDWTKNRISKTDLLVPSRNRSECKIGDDKEARHHEIVYSTARRPNPSNPAVLEFYPFNIELREGVIADCTDAELNFYLTNANFTLNGKAKTKANRPLIMLFKKDELKIKAEKEIDMREKAISMAYKIKGNPKSVISAAKAILTIEKINKKYFTLNHSIINNPSDPDYQAEISGLLNGIIKFAMENPQHFIDVMNHKLSSLYKIVEYAMSSDVLYLDKSTASGDVQGSLVMNIRKAQVILCPVLTTEQPFEKAIEALQSKTGSEYVIDLEQAIKQHV